MTRLALKRSRPYAEFKKATGQNNHFLITLLVGLDAVQDGIAVKKPDFSTVWEPHDVVASAERSRDYAIRTSLTWVTELLQVYWRAASSLPGVCSDDERRRIDGGKDDGASKRLQRFADHLRIPTAVELDMVRLAIHWRNKVVHSKASGDLEGDVRGRLRRTEDEIRARFSGMDVLALIEGERVGRAPTFKEVASMMKASHLLAAAFDAAAVPLVDLEQLTESAINSHLRGDSRADWISRTQATWTGDPDRARRRLTSIVKAQGLQETADRDTRTLAEAYLSELSTLTLGEARARFPEVAPVAESGTVATLPGRH